MAKLNASPPPQTYSRLFRPWDTKMDDSGINMASSSSRLAGLKTECCIVDIESIDSMSTDNSEMGTSEGEDIDVRSISNSINDSDSETPAITTPPLTPPSQGSLSESNLGNTNNYTTSTPSNKNSETTQLPQTGQLSQFGSYQPFTMFSGVATPSVSPPSPTSSLYYAAATINSLSLPNSLPNYNMDSYPIAMMGQEYARVIAEDAHMKALNARKQRPKKFKCPHCEIAFSNNGQLKGHIRIHTGERPFKCDTEGCGKNFTRNEELTRHKRIHTGLRPFPCSTCGKKFGRRDHLKKHMKTHLPQEHHMIGAAPYLMQMYPYMFVIP